MTTTKPFILLTLSILIAACGSKTSKNVFQHNYEKYWDKYSKQKLTDTLFSDTLLIKTTIEGRSFYINTIKELLADLKDDQNNTDSLYPMAAFDELTIRTLPFGFKKTFTSKQANTFLEIINDPVSFDWAETAYEPEYRVDFLKDNAVVATLTIGADKSVVKTEPDWPGYKKMKFGHLKSKPFGRFVKLLNEVD